MSDSNFQKQNLGPDDLIEISDRHILKINKFERLLHYTFKQQISNLEETLNKSLSESGIASLSGILYNILGLSSDSKGARVKLLKMGQKGWRLGYLKLKIQLEIEAEPDPNDPLIVSQLQKIVGQYSQNYPTTVSRQELLNLLNNLIVLIPGKELPMGKTVHGYLNTLLDSFKQGKLEDLIEADKNQVVHKALDRILAILTENTPENPSPNSSNDTIEGEIIETETSPLDDIRKTLNQTLNP